MNIFPLKRFGSAYMVEKKREYRYLKKVVLTRANLIALCNISSLTRHLLGSLSFL